MQDMIGREINIGDVVLFSFHNKQCVGYVIGNTSGFPRLLWKPFLSTRPCTDGPMLGRTLLVCFDKQILKHSIVQELHEHAINFNKLPAAAPRRAP